MRKVTCFFIFILFAVDLEAQTPAPPPPVRTWTGNFGAGLAATSGNTDTKNINLSLDLLRDPKKRSTIRMKALYLRGDENKVVTVDRLNMTGRDEIKVSAKMFVFGQGDYTRDTFKKIDYLFSPTVGVGYTFVHTDRALFAVDAGVGGIVERDTGGSSVSGGATNASERFSWKLSKTATVTQSIASLWKTSDWSDSLHNASVGLAASVTAKTEIKVEVLDSFKNRPGSPTVKKNDISFITAFVFKF